MTGRRRSLVTKKNMGKEHWLVKKRRPTKKGTGSRSKRPGARAEQAKNIAFSPWATRRGGEIRESRTKRSASRRAKTKESRAELCAAPDCRK